MPRIKMLLAFIAVAGVLALGCTKSIEPTGSYASASDEIVRLEAIAKQTCTGTTPSPLVTVNLGGNALTFWPFTSDDLSNDPQDPINVIFFGKADPRDIRAALMSLDGDRLAFGMPPVPPFNSTWVDAIGDVQASFGQNCGWSAGVVQLACGDYSPARFHLRLFKIGNWTVGNAHFEILIPGTTDHQVISWELAEQFVKVDLIRSGLLAPDLPFAETGDINPAPFRTIPSIIYNGLPIELRAAIGGPLGDVSADVPILTDGKATMMKVASKVPRNTGVFVQDFVLNFDQVIPKPFCSSGPGDYVYVSGPVHLRQTTRLSALGIYQFNFFAEGELSVTPVNPMTGEPIGETIPATVRESHSGLLTNVLSWASSTRYQRLGAQSDPEAAVLFDYILVNSPGLNYYKHIERCGDETF